MALLPYKTPRCAPSEPPRASDPLITSGSVAPMSVVGTMSTSNAMASRAAVSAGSARGSGWIERDVDLLKLGEDGRGRQRGGCR